MWQIVAVVLIASGCGDDTAMQQSADLSSPIVVVDLATARDRAVDDLARAPDLAERSDMISGDFGPCGHASEQCCGSGECFDSYTTCYYGGCYGCGGPDQPCCAGGQCSGPDNHCTGTSSLGPTCVMQYH